MKYVLDSSVAFKWEVPERDSDKANLLRDDFRNAIHELVAPDFLPLDLADAFRRAEKPGLRGTLGNIQPGPTCRARVAPSGVNVPRGAIQAYSATRTDRHLSRRSLQSKLTASSQPYLDCTASAREREQRFLAFFTRW